MGGGSSKTTTSSNTQSPWAGQSPYLLDAFSRAQGAMGQASATPQYSGDITAQDSPYHLGALGNSLNLATGQGGQVINGLLNNGSAQFGEGQSGVGSAMTGMLSSAFGNSPQNNISGAQQYAAGENIPAMVAAATYGANRNAAENTLPTLYRGADLTNNLNSDRTALAQGVVQRGLSENAQNIGAQLQNDAYKNGLNLSEQDNAQRLQALSQAGSLGANQTQQGNSAIGAAGYQIPGITNAAEQAGAGLTANAQAGDTNALQKYQLSQSAPFSALQQYMNIIGNRSWGGSSTGVSKSQDSPSGMSTAGSIMGGLGSLFGNGGSSGGVLGGIGGALSSFLPLAGL